MMTDMTVTDEAPLSIDAAACHARRSRSTIERAIRLHRGSDGCEGLRSRRATPREQNALASGETGPRITVVIDRADLDRWLDGLPPLPATEGVPVAA
jgi:hypothetical protein